MLPLPPDAKLTEKDTVVLADFANTTGDPVFDGRCGRAVGAIGAVAITEFALGPSANAQTLRLMGHNPKMRG